LGWNGSHTFGVTKYGNVFAQKISAAKNISAESFTASGSISAESFTASGSISAHGYTSMCWYPVTSVTTGSGTSEEKTTYYHALCYTTTS
jgi:hypothetical protein